VYIEAPLQNDKKTTACRRPAKHRCKTYSNKNLKKVKNVTKSDNNKETFGNVG